MEIREWFGLGPSKIVQENRALIAERGQEKEQAYGYVQESMMTMLSIALEDRGWIRTDGFDRQAGNHLSFKAIQSAAMHGTALTQGNPIMERAALAKTGYVFGNGLRIQGADSLLKSRKNKKALFSESAYQTLQFAKIATGNILILVEGGTVDLIPFYEITGAVYDPNNSANILYFLRTWKQRVTDFATNTTREEDVKRFYPNMDYERGGVPYPDSIASIPVHQDGVIKHVAANKSIGGAWGVPDLLAGIFYAGEHKELIEAADSIFRAQSQYAITYKTKTRAAFENVAASIAAPPPIDPATGASAQYGQSQAFGNDIEMQLMGKIGGGIDFNHFDPIAALASVVLAVPLNVVLGKEEATDGSLPFSSLQTMKMEQRFWSEVFRDVLEYMGVSAKKLRISWPKIDPDPTHRQVQSIVGAAATKVITPVETRDMLRETFGTDWEEEEPDPTTWDAFAPATTAPGSTEPAGGTITPGQGQTGKIGKLADGDHELRDAGGQAHTEK